MDCQILSKLVEAGERVKGLQAGSDDYVAKPFAFSEPLMRLEALARRTQPDIIATPRVP